MDRPGNPPKGVIPLLPVEDRPSSDPILSVGLTEEENSSLPFLLFGALGATSAVVDFEDLSDEHVSSAIAVISPVIGETFDTVDLAKRLFAVGYQGRYYAFSTDLPDSAMIRLEVAAVAPDLAYDIINVSPHLTLVPKEP